MQKIHENNPGLKPAHISPISSGVYLLWRIGNLDVDIEIDEESAFYYEYSNKKAKEIYSKECFYSGDLEGFIDEIVGRIVNKYTGGCIEDV